MHFRLVLPLTLYFGNHSALPSTTQWFSNSIIWYTAIIQISAFHETSRDSHLVGKVEPKNFDFLKSSETAHPSVMGHTLKNGAIYASPNLLLFTEEGSRGSIMDPSTAEGVMVLDDSVGVMRFYGNLIRQGGRKAGVPIWTPSQHS